MNVYLSAKKAVIDMQQRGFDNDFQLFHNTLLWVQDKSLLQMKAFAIVEYHNFYDHNLQLNIKVFGIVANSEYVKGILLNHYSRYCSSMPEILMQKLKELQIRSSCQFNI